MTRLKKPVLTKGLAGKIRIILLVSTVLIFAVLGIFFLKGKKNADVYVVLRYDDYYNGSSINFEEKLIDFIEVNRLSCTYGIIPFSIDSTRGLIPLDSEKVNLLKPVVQSGLIEVSQHGYLHLPYDSVQPLSEFRGMKSEDQYKAIITGKDFLENAFGSKVVTFIPPWNSYDSSTLAVLNDLDFKVLSADENKSADRNSQLSYLPFTTDLHAIKGLLECTSLPGFNHPAVIVLLLHDYDFKEINPTSGTVDLGEFEKTILNIKEKKWEIVSIREITQKLSDFTPQTYNQNKLKVYLLHHLEPVIKFLPGFGKLSNLKSIFVSGQTANLLLVLVILYYLIAMLIAAEIMYWILSRILRTRKYNVFYIIGGFLLLVISVLVFYLDDQVVLKTEAFVLVVLFAFILSMGYFTYGKTTKDITD